QTARARKERQTLVISATFTAEPLAEPLAYWLRELELPADITFAPYNQVFQQLLDPSGLFASNQRGLNIILLRLEDWQSSGQSPDGTGVPGWEKNIERSVAEFGLALKAAAARSAVPCL